MAAKQPKVVYCCTACGGQAPKWQGQCTSCGEWNTLVETIQESSSSTRFSGVAGAPSRPQNLVDIQARDEVRIGTGIDEFDRVLGGGLVAGGVVLLGGDPGIGKFTLLLQALSMVATKHQVLYVSGEESAEQVALRARRLQVDPTGVRLLAEVNLEKIIATLSESKPRIVVIDSIQTIYSDALQSAPGSVGQVREGAAQLTRYAKQTGTCVVFIGHVTKAGDLAGPRVLEHIVDTVLYFEGDTQSSFRLVRSFKNRFGPANELGVFAMTDRGLKGVSNPSALFLSQHNTEVAGSCVMVTQEGIRPLLVEIQALLDESHSPSPRRLSVGLEQNRLAMLLAVLHRHASIGCFDQDVFVNAVGGVRISEPAADLPVLLAIMSSLRNKPLPGNMVSFGEVGLAGEIRPAPKGQERLKEAVRLGFTLALVPQGNAPKNAIPGLQVLVVDRIDQAMAKIFSRE